MGPEVISLAKQERATFAVKAGLAQMLKGGVIMDVVNEEQARIAEEAGAVAGARAGDGSRRRLHCSVAAHHTNAAFSLALAPPAALERVGPLWRCREASALPVALTRGRRAQSWLWSAFPRISGRTAAWRACRTRP